MEKEVTWQSIGGEDKTATLAVSLLLVLFRVVWTDKQTRGPKVSMDNTLSGLPWFSRSPRARGVPSSGCWSQSTPLLAAC